MKSAKFLNKIMNNDLDNLISKFNLVDIQTYQYTTQGSFIVIFIKEQSSDRLESNWNKISNVVSEYLEEFITYTSMRWNIYIIYLIDIQLSKEIKYKTTLFLLEKLLKIIIPLI